MPELTAPRAVLWDMDGTLVDTEPYWMTAETELAAAFGLTWTEAESMQLVGSGLLDAGRILQRHGIDMEPQEIVDALTDRVRELLASEGVPFRPGARELLAALKDAGIPTALVTMSLRRMAEDVVSLIDFPAFDLIIAGDEVERPKPHPEAYLRAAERLGVAPGEAIALEDSPTGLTAALAAETVAIGVPHIVGPTGLDHVGAHAVWQTLAGRGVTDLADVFAAHGPTGRS